MDLVNQSGDVESQRIDLQVAFGASPRWQFAVIPTPVTSITPFSVMLLAPRDR